MNFSVANWCCAIKARLASTIEEPGVFDIEVRFTKTSEGTNFQFFIEHVYGVQHDDEVLIEALNVETEVDFGLMADKYGNVFRNSLCSAPGSKWICDVATHSHWHRVCKYKIFQTFWTEWRQQWFGLARSELLQVSE